MGNHKHVTISRNFVAVSDFASSLGGIFVGKGCEGHKNTSCVIKMLSGKE